jgi:hypothetical protein
VTAHGARLNPIRDYPDKIWNLPETPGMFHRLTPNLPLETRCGILLGPKARSTSHSLIECNPCPVCFEDWPGEQEPTA